MEASQDKQWGTGVQLHDQNVLKLEKWNGDRWMSTMLDTIRDLEVPNTS